jgi:hypothetical protein
MKMILKSRNLKRVLGLKVHHDGFKLIDYLEWSERGSLREIEVDINLVLQLEERPSTPLITL